MTSPNSEPDDELNDDELARVEQLRAMFETMGFLYRIIANPEPFLQQTAAMKALIDKAISGH